MITAVLADDHPMFREGLRFTLDQAGIHVLGEADDGVQALDLAAATDPDVVIMDLAMPRMDGLTATERLTSAGSRARVLVLTMSEDDAQVFAALQAGASGYLVKGVAPDQVVAAVEALASGHAVFGPGLAHRLLDFFGRRPPSPGRFPELSPREHEILTHVAEGLSNAQIAERLVISPITVRNHVTSILAKLQVTNRREAMLRYNAP